jgi:hypothetical protein
LGRPAKKKTYWESKKKRLGELQAEREMHRKKPLEESFKEHIGKMIDRVDPIELVAVAGMTVIVHQTVIGAEDLLKKVSTITNLPFSLSTGTFQALTSGSTQGFFITEIKTFGDILTNLGIIKTTAENSTPNEILTWMVCFAIAYVMIHNAHQLLNIMDQGLGAVIGLMLA